MKRNTLKKKKYRICSVGSKAVLPQSGAKKGSLEADVVFRWITRSVHSELPKQVPKPFWQDTEPFAEKYLLCTAKEVS